MVLNNTPHPTIELRLGQVVATPGAIHAMAAEGLDPADLLACHRRGDWGDLSAEDHQANDEAVLTGGRVLSAYSLASGNRLWVITEADRSITTILLPDEY